MSIKFRLVKRPNLGKDKKEVPEKMYAQPVYSDLVRFEDILLEIIEAGIPSSQVKGVADRMNLLISRHLAAGRRVQFGEFGTFRYGIGSGGSLTAKEFDSGTVKVTRIVFAPGSALRFAKKNVKFEKYVVSGTTDSGGSSGESDGEKPEEL